MQWIAHYGYVAIFSLLVLGIIGLPIPDETLLLFVGYLIYKGQLRAIPSLASAFLGSLCGITLSYAVGRTFGLTFGYYVPGVRHLTAYVAGASKLELPVFALFAYSGGLLWAGTFIGLGYGLGQRWSKVGLGQLHLAMTAAVVLVLFFLYIRYRRRGSA